MYHPVGTTVIIAFGVHNLLDLVNYVAGQVAGTIGTATNLVTGSTKLSVAAVSPTIPIAVGDNDPRLVVSTTSIALLSYPVGSIYMSTVATNPNTLFGFGTWVAYGVGRVLIGAGTGTKVATISSVTSSVITATGLTNNSNNEFQTGQAVVASTTAGNLVATTTYYVIRVSNTTFSLATTLANAQNGVVKTLAGTESGTLTLTLTARTAGDTGGEENHAMSSTELLAHTHSIVLGNTSGSTNIAASNTGGNVSTPSTNSTGGNAAMNNMQPFISVYMWNRVS